MCRDYKIVPCLPLQCHLSPAYPFIKAPLPHCPFSSSPCPHSPLGPTDLSNWLTSPTAPSSGKLLLMIHISSWLKARGPLRHVIQVSLLGDCSKGMLMFLQNSVLFSRRCLGLSLYSTWMNFQLDHKLYRSRFLALKKAWNILNVHIAEWKRMDKLL